MPDIDFQLIFSFISNNLFFLAVFPLIFILSFSVGRKIDNVSPHRHYVFNFALFFIIFLAFSVLWVYIFFYILGYKLQLP